MSKEGINGGDNGSLFVPRVQSSNANNGGNDGNRHTIG